MLTFSQNIQYLSCKDTVLLRVDFNLSRDKDGVFVITHRFMSMLPVIKQIVAKGCSLIIVSHLGRPKSGVRSEVYSFASLAPVLAEAIDMPVSFLSHWPQQKTYLAPGSVALAENIRFHEGDANNSKKLAEKMVEDVTLVVMEAFACSHRNHASTVGIVDCASRVILGPCHEQEIVAIEKFRCFSGKRMAIVAGKKITTKLALLEQMVEKMDVLCLAGGIANTLLHCQGFNLGCSFVEYSQLRAASALMDLIRTKNIQMVLPVDVVVCENLQDSASVRTTTIDAIDPQEQIIDVGPKTIEHYKKHLHAMEMVYWNGPLGIYEHEFGMAASASLAQALSDCSASTLLGGGDTLSLLHVLGCKGYSHVSMGGGAFLHYMAHGTSPVLSAMSAYEDGNQLCEEQRS